MSATGKHTVACCATFAARYGAHSGMAHVFHKAAGAATAASVKEPTSRSVLNDAFTDEECRALCPRGQSKLATKLAEEVRILAEKIHALAIGSEDHARLTQQMRRALAQARDKEKTKGVRLDQVIQFRDRTIFSDNAGVHPTSSSIISAVRTWRRKVAAGLIASAGNDRDNPTARLPSPAIVNTTIAKRKRFATLMEAARSQYPRLRRHKPTLLIPVITHTGEMSPDMIELIEILTNESVIDYKPGYMNMGRTRKRQTGAFRARLKDAIMASNARGFGRALRAAGNPMTGHCLSFDDVGIPSWEGQY